LTITITQLFAPTVLSTGAATIYTVPSTPPSVLPNLRVRFVNTTAGPVTITAFAIQPGGAAGTANCVANAESIAANAHLDLDIPVLPSGGFFQAQASANTSVTVSELAGVLFTP